MTGPGHAWTVEEDDILLDRRASGQRFAQIAQAIGRTPKAVHTRYHVLTRDPGANAKSRERMVREASETLMEKMLDAQVRFANHKGLTLEQAQVFLMGGNYYTPSASPFQTCSIQRLSNRIHSAVEIGEIADNSDLSPKIAA